MAKSIKEDNNGSKDNYYFQRKCKTLLLLIRENIYENAIICDEISQTQEKLLIVQEECKFLMKKLKLFEPQLATVDIETVKKAINRKKSNNISNIFNAGIIRPKRLPAKCKKNTSDIKDDEVEQPIISGNITIFTLGEIVYETPYYYNDRALYPVGYYSTRVYAHFRNIYSKCTYHCKIIKAGTSPRFEIMDNDKHFKVSGLSTDECHSHLISLINKMLGTTDLIPANRNGDRFFGLTLPPVRFKLQERAESKLCTGYIPLKTQFDQDAELRAENDPSINFESLHTTLKRIRSKR